MQCLWQIPLLQNYFSVTNDFWLIGCFSDTFFLNSIHKFQWDLNLVNFWTSPTIEHFLAQEILNNLTLVPREPITLCMKMLHRWTDIGNCNICLKFHIFCSIYGHSRRQSVDHRSTSSWYSHQTICSEKCFTVRKMHFLWIRFPQGRQTRCMRTEKCYTEDWSENSTFHQSSDVQLRRSLAKLRRFFFIRVKSRGFRAGFYAFRPNLMFNRLETVEWLIFTPDCRNSSKSFCQRLMEIAL